MARKTRNQNFNLIMKKIISKIILLYLRFFAKFKLKRINPVIIGVTGSVGKSSLISALHTIISSKYETKTTFKGNSESGIPLEILNIKLNDFSWQDWLKAILLAPLKAIFANENYKVLIVEMGVDSPKEPKNMSYLLKIVKPQIGIILNIAPVHTEQFNGDVDAIAREKGLLLTTMEEKGKAIINIDDSRLTKLLSQIKAETVTFGWSKKSDFQIVKHEIHDFNSHFCFAYKDKTFDLSFKDRIFSREYGHIFAAAILTSFLIGIDFGKATSLLQNNYISPPGRLTLLDGEKNSKIIDSSYNASPAAFSAIFDLIKNLKVSGRKIGILGDMRELGVLAQKEHEKVGVEAAKIFSTLILVGPLMKKFCFPALIKCGFPREKVFLFEKSEGVGDFVKEKLLTSGDLILAKGSQNTIFLEQAVYELMKEKEKVSKLLCRQSDYWRKTRKRFFS